MSKRTILPVESQDQCRKRIMQECHRMWSSQTEEAALIRREYSQLAKEKNKHYQLVEAHDTSFDAVSTSMDSANEMSSSVEVQSKPIYLPTIKVWRGNGAMSIGDSQFGISKEIVKAESEKDGFVSGGSRAWKERAGGTVCGNDEFRVPMKLSCFEEFGFCWRTVSNKDLYTRLEKHLMRFVQEHRKKFLHKKNLGPNANVNQPVLLAWDRFFGCFNVVSSFTISLLKSSLC